MIWYLSKRVSSVNVEQKLFNHGKDVTVAVTLSGPLRNSKVRGTKDKYRAILTARVAFLLKLFERSRNGEITMKKVRKEKRVGMSMKSVDILKRALKVSIEA